MAPRLSSRKPRQTPKPTPAFPPNERAEIGSNSMHGEEAERVQLISFVTKLTKDEAAIEAARAPFDAAKKIRTQTVNYAKAAGFTEKELKRRQEEMNTPTRKNATEIAREYRHRRWLGIIDADAHELMLGESAPQEVKDEAHWKGEGYKAGLRQMEAKPPSECSERFVQPWMLEWERGFKESTEANAPKPIPKSTAEQAKADYAADNPDVDVAKAARKLKNDPKFMDRTPVPEIVDEDPLGANGDFEAAPEELAAQKPRLAVVGGRVEEDDVV